MVNGFEYHDIDAIDLLDKLILHGFDSGKFKLGLVIEGEVIQRMEGKEMVNISGGAIGDVLDKVCAATGTAYDIKDGRIIIKTDSP